MSTIEIKGRGCVLSLILCSIWLFSLLIGVYALGYTKGLKTAVNSLKIELSEPIVEEEPKVEVSESWDDFIKALIMVESEDNSCAIGSKDDVGVLQIRKVIVDDCNRILGYDKYSYEDRKDSIKSVEMFNVIQDHYNPDKDLHFALKLWNSKAPIAYHRKVFAQLEKISKKDLESTE